MKSASFHENWWFSVKISDFHVKTTSLAVSLIEMSLLPVDTNDYMDPHYEYQFKKVSTEDRKILPFNLTNKPKIWELFQKKNSCAHW